MALKKLRLDRKRKHLILYCLLILSFVLLFFLFRKQMISIVFTVMLMILGSMSNIFKRITGSLSLGIEFITFATILLIYSYGIPFALIACLVMSLVSALSTGQLSLSDISSYGMYVVISLISLLLPFSIATNGIILMLIMNILGLFMLTLLGFDFIRNATYVAGNIFLNFILFKYFSAIIFTLL
jgi:hypothetical protein